MRHPWFALTLMLLLAASAVIAQEAPSGQVQIPLDVYAELLAKSRGGTDPKAPVNYATGSAQVNVQVRTEGASAKADVSVTLTIEIFEDTWVLVPVLPAGTPVHQVLVGGRAAQLVTTPGGLAFSTNKKGTYQMTLSYRVDASASGGGGHVLGVPLPEAASTQLTASLPGTGLDVAVIPAAGVRVSASGNTTRVQATLPSTTGAQISWRTPTGFGASFSRATYRGTLRGDAVVWRAELAVELLADETVTLRLLPRGVTLTSVRVDGQDAPIVVEGKHFATLVKGRGAHTVIASFETPVVSSAGPPSVQVDIPKVPVSRFELTLPGQKEVSATPVANATSQVRGGNTVATVNVPLTDRVTLSWSESVPAVVRKELRANATIYHVVHAEEGVLFTRARVAYDVRRGETNRLELVVPENVQVNRVESADGAVADWRVTAIDGAEVLQVFLDRQLQGELTLDVWYDRSLAPEQASALPLMSARGVGRQRGMVALLSSRDLTLEPVDESDATRVGENQLPSFVRDAIEMTVAHTFKYAELPPELTVTPTLPERVAGRFDAQVDSLLSLGDVTLTTTASAAIYVKSGGIDQLSLVLPAGATLLDLSAPSLRSQRPSDDDPRVIELEFTQEMVGQFRVDLSYERILSPDEGEIDGETLHVTGADVEQGVVAVEASSAVEVLPGTFAELSPVEIGELPRQLVLQTTNPILLAFKYVRADPLPQLALRVTRHRVVDVQEAAIDSAAYKTLVTRDGLVVTTARFFVRNQRKQFLRIELPEGAEIWSVFVSGRPEKPALAEENDGSVLIKIMNRTEGFPVDVIYAVQTTAIRWLGTVESQLPRPDILVTESHWDLFLPDGLSYGSVASNLDAVTAQTAVSSEEIQNALGRVSTEDGSTDQMAPLRITVPANGVHFSFRKLYANQGDIDANVTIPYSTTSGTTFGQLVSFAAMALLWLGGWMLSTGSDRLTRRAQLALVSTGGIVLAVAAGVYHVSLIPALLISLAMAATSATPYAREFLQRSTEEPVEEQG